MQQTRLDHWLRHRFVHQTRIYCNVLPDVIGPHCAVEEAGAGQPGSHRYRITPSDDNALVELVGQLRCQGITYAASIDDKTDGIARWINRPDRSVTCDVVWYLLIFLSATSTLILLPYGKIASFLTNVWPF